MHCLLTWETPSWPPLPWQILRRCTHMLPEHKLQTPRACYFIRRNSLPFQPYLYQGTYQHRRPHFDSFSPFNKSNKPRCRTYLREGMDEHQQPLVDLRPRLGHPPSVLLLALALPLHAQRCRTGQGHSTTSALQGWHRTGAPQVLNHWSPVPASYTN